MASGAWSESDKARYRRGSFAIALLGYGGVATVALAASMLGDLERLVTMAALAVVVVICLAHAVLGRITRAPGVFNGAIITLIAAGIPAIGGLVLFTVVEPAMASVLPPLALLGFRVLGAIAAVIGGALVTAYWSSDAASSDAVVGD